MPILIIDNVWVSLDLLEKHFCCYLSKCKGVCCIKGDSGAPLEDNEIQLLKDVFPIVNKYLGQRNKQSIFEQGLFEIDDDGDKVTTLVEGKECIFTIFEKGIAKCAIEKAFFEHNTHFRKPISCFLYPIRIKKLPDCDVLNYDKWYPCKSARKYGKQKSILIYQFLKEALIKKYDNDWYMKLEKTANDYVKTKIDSRKKIK